ncbi:MAG: citrate lyase holo-[acyl-carrier protein] synthase [Lachnospiraceae bacterium]|nr:citrate lyase holo-[acyl-carrier protein] synthase [Lachnospiraceae bacterium]
MLIGEQVTVPDMMECRERRAMIQDKYLAKYKTPVLSFCMNIPGPIKTNALLRQAFDEAVISIYDLLDTEDFSIQDFVQLHEKTGDELIMSIACNAADLKNKTTKLEESHPLGRLFDIDIIDVTGQKLSRPAFRKCLLCDCQAQDCARSRKHTVEEMQDKIEEMISEYFS